MSTAVDFSVDSRVHAYNNKSAKGTVIGHLKKQGDKVVAIEWDDGILAAFNTDDLVLIDTVEEEFEKIRESINEKLRAAATLIGEASDLAGAEDLDLQDYDSDDDDHYFDFNVLERAMENAGWNTSSWHC